MTCRNNGIDPIELSIKDKSRWNSLLINSLYPSYRQSLNYVYTKQIRKRKILTYIFTKEGEDIAGIHYLIKKTHLNVLITVEVFSGIVFKYEPDKQLLRFICNHLFKIAKSKNAFFVSINPWLPEYTGERKNSYVDLFKEVLSQKGFKVSIKGRHTYWIDLTQSNDMLLKRMHSKTRYQINLGKKSGIETEIVGKVEHDLIQLFWSFYNTIGQKKQLRMYSEGRFKQEVINLVKSGEALLFILKYGNEIINISIASVKGISSYLHGAINYNYKLINGCPSPGQLAQWEMIQEMKRRGLKVYDMGFCPGHIPNKSHSAYSIWNFKYKFGGMHVQFLPTYGKPLKPIRGRLFEIFGR